MTTRLLTMTNLTNLITDKSGIPWHIASYSFIYFKHLKIYSKDVIVIKNLPYFPNISDVLTLKANCIPIGDILKIIKYYLDNDRDFIMKTSVTFSLF